ncbi:MAG TPA: hypothetical protein VI818_05225 [Candidatus Thermoplasmatota archaeon]|nr:hypothetical protein [Candidatus Thermoplasmatota archaeon]
MSAGHLVFPVVIVGFIAFMGSFLIANPAMPPVSANQPTPSSTLLDPSATVQLGDRVTIELTAFYGPVGQGSVFFSTEQERATSLPIGRIQPSLQTSPISIQVPLERAGPLDLPTLLLGHRVGDAYTTPLIPSDEAFGDWEEERTLSRTLANLPVEVRYDSSTFLGGEQFNASQYVEHWRREGIDLKPGTVWSCENEELWQCRALEADEDANVLRYQRVVTDGQAYAMSAVVAGVQVTGDFAWNVTTVVSPDGLTFDLRVDPPVGVRFQFREPLTQEIRSGTYEVLRVDASSFQANYTTVDNTNADLVGEDIYYEVTIVRITR